MFLCAQYFKFTAANPLAVRTKARVRWAHTLRISSGTLTRRVLAATQVRALPGGGTLLEACVENLTKARDDDMMGTFRDADARDALCTQAPC